MRTHLARKTEAHTEEFITKAELSRKLKVCTRTVENLTNKGIIPVIKVGASSRYNWKQVIAAIQSNQPANH